MYLLISFAVGLLFGVGLIISGMANPAKVLGFLDLAGAWDPSLALVMAGAIAVGVAGFAAAGRRAHSWLGLPIQLPSNRIVDQRLVLGGLLFGAGWGLAGFCPGPVVVALGAGYWQAGVFVASMLVGMAVYEGAERFGARRDMLSGRG